MCHASCLASLPDGTLLCTWFGGSREGNPDTEIYFSMGSPVFTETNVGNRMEDISVEVNWTEPVKLTDLPEACWNPVLMVKQDKLLLFFKTGNSIASWQTMVMVGNGTPPLWSPPMPLVREDTSGGRGPVRAKPVVLASGRICAGGSIERGEWQSFCDYSDDGGATWTRSALLGINLLDDNLLAADTAAGTEIRPEDLPPVSSQSLNGRGVIQPVIWQETNGLLHMFMRSTEGYVYKSYSDDMGKSWSQPVPTSLRNNNSGLDVMRVPGGAVFTACNPVKGSWGPRTPLTLFIGSEDGSVWDEVIELEKGKGEYSYPSLTYFHRGIWCSYTYNRENIAVAFLTWREIAGLRRFRQNRISGGLKRPDR